MDKWLIDKAVGKRIVDRETLVTKQHANKNSLRNYGFNNIRALLIIAVVFGHLLELSSFKGSALIYQTIYSFHMPAFVFLVGYWARYDVKKILFNYVLPYVLFQTIYIYFAQNVLGIPTELQYAVPYWHLWFLMACMFYQLLLPLYPTLPAKKQLMTLISVFVLALFVGYDDTVGFYGTLSRFFVFQPYFILGYYYRGKETQISKACAGKKRIGQVAICVIVLISVAIIYLIDIPNNAFYGSYSYSAGGGSVEIRALIMLMAFSWIAFLLSVLRPLLNRCIPVLTIVGQNTLPVFLLHAFVIKVIPRFMPIAVSTPAYVILTTCATVLCFGNAFVGKIFKFLFLGQWLQKSK